MAVEAVAGFIHTRKKIDAIEQVFLLIFPFLDAGGPVVRAHSLDSLF